MTCRVEFSPYPSNHYFDDMVRYSMLLVALGVYETLGDPYHQGYKKVDVRTGSYKTNKIDTTSNKW